MINNNEDDDIFEGRKVKSAKLYHETNDETYIFKLNDDCLLEIFRYLTLQDILNVQNVCQRWRIVSQCIWRTLKSFDCVADSEGAILSFSSDRKFEKDYIINTLHEVRRILHYCHDYITDFTVFDDRENSPIFAKVIKMISEQCKNLQYITIGNFYGVALSDIEPLKNNCVNIEKIHISEINPECQQLLSEIIKNNPKIKSFSFGRDYYPIANAEIECEFIQFLRPNIIEEIELISCPKVQPNIFTSLLKKCKCLYFLKYGPESKSINKEMMKAIEKNRTLIKLNLSCNNVTSPTLYNLLAKLVNLNELNLSKSIKLNNENVIKITSHCQQLRILNLSNCHLITDPAIESICKLKHLTYLNLNALYYITDKEIANLPDTITILILKLCKKVKDHGVKIFIQRAINLMEIDLSYTAITYSTLTTALEIAKNRRTENYLEINIFKTGINPDFLMDDLPPLLEISRYNSYH